MIFETEQIKHNCAFLLHEPKDGYFCNYLNCYINSCELKCPFYLDTQTANKICKNYIKIKYDQFFP